MLDLFRVVGEAKGQNDHSYSAIYDLLQVRGNFK